MCGVVWWFLVNVWSCVMVVVNVWCFVLVVVNVWWLWPCVVSLPKFAIRFSEVFSENLKKISENLKLFRKSDTLQIF